jgi:2-polyprenyl-6-methoxyphenol hydroxylase-like FAD-dependent oxidoreductase
VGPCVGISRVRLQEVLRAAAVTVPTRLGVTVTALSQGPHRATVGFSDGSAGCYDLVVGADGIYSTVRALAFDTAPPAYAGTMCWRSIVPCRPSGLSEMMILMG